MRLDSRSKIPARLTRAVSSGNRPLILRCSQVPNVEPAWDHVVVRCLKPLGTDSYATMAAQAERADRPSLTVMLPDCSSCPLNKTVHEEVAGSAAGSPTPSMNVDVRERLARAQKMLTESSHVGGESSELRHQDVTLESASATARSRWRGGGITKVLVDLRHTFSRGEVHEVDAGVSRRDLLFGPGKADDAHGVPAVTTERGMLLAALPDALIETPRIVNGDCSSCEACVKTCEFDALAMVRDGDNASLFVRPEMCISCGECVGMCPEQCLALGGAHRADAGSVLLAASVLNTCSGCGRELNPGEDGTCTSCRARGDLLSDLRTQLGAAR